VSGSCALPPRWPPQFSCVVIESSFDPCERLQAPVSLWFIYIIYIYIGSKFFFNIKEDQNPVNSYPIIVFAFDQPILTTG
jgi:hypothetical protein